MTESLSCRSLSLESRMMTSALDGNAVDSSINPVALPLLAKKSCGIVSWHLTCVGRMEA
ncbi:hypothetical protein [Paenarthrobacter nicotinovorans]|uniref:hypothetical protein n=1 Tax=Paenarthrobacter nicotinovorans TaxID=29320 RepID=UPI001EE2FCEF|nr:hypothetical protein [Paenarthrobacter nicotinovorans]